MKINFMYFVFSSMKQYETIKKQTLNDLLKILSAYFQSLVIDPLCLLINYALWSSIKLCPLCLNSCSLNMITFHCSLDLN